MNQKQIQLVRRSWRIFQQMDPVLIGEIFYEKLFNDVPSLKRLFPKTLDAQSQKLIDMLSTIVARLDRQDELIPQLHAMGERHIKYRVKQEHYKYVGLALIWTLKRGFGKDWHTELEEAWLTCYNEITEHMTSVYSAEFQPRGRYTPLL